MFVRIKPSGPRQYLQIVSSFRHNGKVKQRVIATLGRLDFLSSSGQIDALSESLARFSAVNKTLQNLKAGTLSAHKVLKIGPSLLFEKLWSDLGIPSIIKDLAKRRKYKFSLERASFLSVLHRMFESGADRQADLWRRDVFIRNTEKIQLHQLYRTMGFLGEEKDQIEDALFEENRDLFSEVSIAFFDTTSIYFEGSGGESIGQYGHSKDHRNDLKQMIVGVVLSDKGMPLSCQMWPGNMSDAKTLIYCVELTLLVLTYNQV